jgi:hypothetical protein
MPLAGPLALASRSMRPSREAAAPNHAASISPNAVMGQRYADCPWRREDTSDTFRRGRDGKPDKHQPSSSKNDVFQTSTGGHTGQDCASRRVQGIRDLRDPAT